MPLVTGLQANVFRAVSGSLFSSPVNWSRGVVPTGSDVAMIADNCTIDISRTIGSLVVRAPFTASINTGLTLQVNDVMNVLGHLSCSGNPTINTFAKTNIIGNFSAGTSTFNYYRIGNQSVPGVTYYNVGMYNQGIKTAIGSIIVSGSLTYAGALTTLTRSFFELSQYDLSVLGNTGLINGFGVLSKSQPGRLLFTGQVSYGNISQLLFTGNPTVEFRGGLSGDPDTNGAFLDSGAGTWIFSTNNQSIQTFGRNINADIYISGSIALSIPSGQTLTVSKIITGTSGSSTLINSGSLLFNTATSVSTFMTIGSANLSSSANTVGFVGNYNLTIPTRFANLWNLTISGAGIKTMSTSSVISGSLSMGTTGSLELGNNNLVLLGGMSGPNDFSNRALFSKSGPGNILFAANIVPNCVNFNLSGNPTVEFRNGANLVNVASFNFGTGSVTFSTNNQTFQSNNTLNLSGSLIVSGSITLTLATFAGGGRMDIYNTINGTTGSSVLVNNTTMYFYNSSSYIPMATSGTFSYLNPLSTLGYMFNGSISLPYTQYHSLVIGGTGSKVLSGDTYLSGSFIYNDNGILDCSVYSLTVSGGFGTPSTNTFIRKNNNIGKLSIYGNAYTNGTTWQLTGNPEIEFRNGLRVLNSTLVSQSFGSGSMVFSQNNQIISATSGLTFANPITISGSITLTLDGFAGVGSHIFSGSINGTEANSRLAIAANGGTPTITYYNSQAPMLTGSIDFTSSLNTFVYGSGSQDIRGGTYRNLTLNGGGVKTLQGNVSVQNTYTLTSPATVNLNGFTLTNP